MKVSAQWVSEWFDGMPPLDVLANRLTMAGLEVDLIEPVAGSMDGIVVARVIESRPHGDADRLSVCRVDTGSGESVDVVCGAPNVRAGLVAAYASPGAVLPDGRAIERTVIRGAESAGMLCSEVELALGDDSSGLLELAHDAPVGMSLSEYLKLDDHVIDIDLTPNRGDCLSILGIAREIAALSEGAARDPDVRAIPARIEDEFSVTLAEPAACPRYAGRVIRNVDAGAPTPVWLKERLRRAGVRSISAVVDVTNYVMLELGQPMHGFDLDRLHGSIVVRNGRNGETLELLDGQTVTLDDQTLVIADERGAVALAGVMGGAASGVEADTTNVFLESAYFDPITLAGVARQFRLHTDASHRFERGVDYTGQERAVERATALILEICGGDPGPVTRAESSATIPRRDAIVLRPEAIERTLGITISRENVASSLRRLHCEITETGPDFSVTPPPFRFDLDIEVDLLEELARIHGYDNIPATLPNTSMSLQNGSTPRERDSWIRDGLIAQGYYEVITYSFIDAKAANLVAPARRVHELANPISNDMAVMRPSIWPALIKAATHNLNRQAEDVRLFELGLVFEQTEDRLEQRHVLAAIAIGRAHPEQWGEESRNLDIFDIKQELENIIVRLNGSKYEWRAGTDEALHPGQTALLSVEEKTVGRIGVLHPAIAQQFDLIAPTVLFELELDLLPAAVAPTFTPISKFPSVRRDISIVLRDDIAAGDVLDLVRRVAGDSLRDLQLFDEYRGQGIDSDKKSLSISLIFQAPSSTLRDEEIEETMKRVLSRLQADFGGTLRN